MFHDQCTVRSNRYPNENINFIANLLAVSSQRLVFLSITFKFLIYLSFCHPLAISSLHIKTFVDDLHFDEQDAGINRQQQEVMCYW